MVERCGEAVKAKLFELRHRTDTMGYDEVARAVIEALMEPDADTVAFGAEAAAAEFDVDLKTLPNTEFMTFIAAAKAAHQAMLRTALSKPNDEGEGK